MYAFRFIRLQNYRLLVNYTYNNFIFLSGKGCTVKRPRLKTTAVPTKHLPVRSLDRFSKKMGFHRVQKPKRKGNDCPGEVHFSEDDASLPGSSVATDALNILAAVCADELERNYTPLKAEYTSGISLDKLNTIPSVSEIPANFSIMDVTLDDDKLNLFTGIGSVPLFNQIVLCTEKVIHPYCFHFSLKGIIIMIFVKMKLNLSFSVLSALFNIPPTSCKRYFQQVVPAVTEVLRTCIVWPEKEEILNSIPQCFKEYKDVSVILDGTEINVEKCKCLRCRILTYSHYKGSNTVKFLVGVSPAGLITFISNGYGGRASDKFITMDSKILDKLLPFRDAVMVDKGFYIDEECANRFLVLYRPAFVQGGKPLSENDSVKSSSIARARVHVERAIQRLKIFKIFKEKLDWFMLRHVDDLMVIAAGVVNLSSPILGNDKF